MKLRKPVFLIIILILAVQLACNWPGRATPTPSAMDVINTAAAQTVVAQLTEIAPKSPTPGSPVPSLLPSPTLLPTVSPPPATALPTAAPTARPTSTPIPCNLAQFVKDVTVPDDTQMTAGTTFTKVWRLKNVGSCTWTPAYAVVFVSGDAMGGSATRVASPVASGSLADISVDSPFATMALADCAVDPKTHPKAARYLDGILSRPSFAELIEKEKALLTA